MIGKDARAAAIVLVNGLHEGQVIPLPGGLWRFVAIDGRANEGKAEVAESMELLAHWGGDAISVVVRISGLDHAPLGMSGKAQPEHVPYSSVEPNRTQDPRG